MLYTADGGGSNKKAPINANVLAAQANAATAAAQAKAAQAAKDAAANALAKAAQEAAAAKAKAAGPPTIQKAQGPYIPGVSNNPAAKASGSGNVTANSTYFPPSTPAVKAAVPAPVKTSPVTVTPVTRPATTLGSQAPSANPLEGYGGGTSNYGPTPSVTPSGGGGSSSSVSTAAPYETDGVTPTMRTGQNMAALTGVMYDRDLFLNQMKNALNAKYANLGTEYERMRGSFLDDTAVAADQMMAGMRRGDQAATMSGLTAGSNTAAQLLAMQGISQDAAKGATELAQTQADLKFQAESDIATAEEKATQMYNELGLGLGALSRQELDSRVQSFGMKLAANSAEEVANIQALAAKYGADKSAAAQLGAAAQQAAATKSAAAMSAAAQAANAATGNTPSIDHLTALKSRGEITQAEYAKMMKQFYGLDVAKLGPTIEKSQPTIDLTNIGTVDWLKGMTPIEKR